MRQFNQPAIHYENPDAKRRFLNLINVTNLDEKLIAIKPREATIEEIQYFHTPEYVKKIKILSDGTGGDAGSFAPFGAGSFEIACLAAGGAIVAVDAVLDARVENAYVLCRPPGHHAESNEGRGFCIFNNIVIAAKHAQQRRGVKRIAIVDYDVHHGNGTEHAFEADDTVLFISVHQDRLYPLDTGSDKDVGVGKGVGFNINIPLPPGSGIGAYTSVFERVVEPALHAYAPDLILVSSGFDASALDPLSHTMLNSSAFGIMARKLVAVANGRIVFVHEGGYSDIHAPFCGIRVVEAMLGVEPVVVDPYDIEIAKYGYQDLQPHQAAVIDRAVENVALMRSRLGSSNQH